MIDHELCPFARRERVRKAIRFVHSQAGSETKLLEALATELTYLVEHPELETTLLIHPDVLVDFSDYNQFLNAADDLLDALDLTGTFQVASFHPDYQFADTTPEDASNYTNRSPYPLLHLLRESSVQRAVNQHADVEGIPDANIARLNAMGVERIRALLRVIEHDK